MYHKACIQYFFTNILPSIKSGYNCEDEILKDIQEFDIPRQLVQMNEKVSVSIPMFVSLMVHVGGSVALRFKEHHLRDNGSYGYLNKYPEIVKCLRYGSSPHCVCIHDLATSKHHQ